MSQPADIKPVIAAPSVPAPAAAATTGHDIKPMRPANFNPSASDHDSDNLARKLESIKDKRMRKQLEVNNLRLEEEVLTANEEIRRLREVVALNSSHTRDLKSESSGRQGGGGRLKYPCALDLSSDSDDDEIVFVGEVKAGGSGRGNSGE
jgi:hypothetical protein